MSDLSCSVVSLHKVSPVIVDCCPEQSNATAKELGSNFVPQSRLKELISSRNVSHICVLVLPKVEDSCSYDEHGSIHKEGKGQ